MIDISPLVARLRQAQAASGGFLSVVRSRGREWQDNNGITALVVRALYQIPGDFSSLEPLRQIALDFLEQCEAPDSPGAYGFWPATAWPAWAPNLPSDADDTAIMALELARAGRLERRDLLDIVCDILLPHRVRTLDPEQPPWIRLGAFQTWLADDPGRPNIVDCCVNTNVAALMAYAGATDLPGYQAACATVEAGIRWAGASPSRLRVLTPFYPHPQELLEALRHATECGADQLQAATRELAAVVQALRAPVGTTPVCSSAYGATVWYAPILETVRNCRQ